jgi:RNA polymerase sigma-70 factor, ECF subfamily
MSVNEVRPVEFLAASAEPAVDWLAQLAAGSDAALSQLIAQWGAALHRFASRYVHNDTVAAEIVQETFVRVYQQRTRYRGDGSPSAWMFTIAANLCHNHRRWQSRHDTLPLVTTPGDVSGETSIEPVATDASPAERLVHAETAAAVRAAIDTLPHDMKVTLLLFEFDDLSYGDIARVVGCSPRGVETRLSRARAKLRERLGGLWDEILQGAEPLARRAGVE